ncbi:hypothetical protein EYW98_08360 [Escherichia coli]|uniref:hypothetical protein n=1 Tax=Escherichia sp. MOD1-EC7003 TaxID=2093900 RepID=UPI000CF766D6|nr:hypothetical protein [Escherichia sp. MOD1-EC7003]EGO8359496.1 hypothetical protein [Escherichia coli]EGO8378167.1 hypothetical protein [Escherichia coli]MCH0695397.1 hypothetical protein [Escherichia coli]
MSIKQHLFAALFLCILTGHAFAATEIQKPGNNLEQISKVSLVTLCHQKFRGLYLYSGIFDKNWPVCHR